MRIRPHLIQTFALAAVAFCAATMLDRAGVRLGAQDTAQAQNALFDAWDGLRVIGKADGTCPTDWSVDTAFRGRYFTGTPENGTNALETGTALTNLEVRRGGHSHGHVYNPISVTYNPPTGSYIAPTVSQTPYNVSYTNPTATSTLTATVTTPAHSHSYAEKRASTDTGQTGSAAPLTHTEANYNTTAASQTTTASVSGGSASLSGGGVSVTGGVVTLSGGSITLSGGSASISGGAVGSGGQAPLPAPYIQVTFCAYDPI